MKYFKFIIFELTLCALLYGCSHNPILDMSADKFALSVNQFDSQYMGHHNMTQSCGEFYLNHKQDNNPLLNSIMQQYCQENLAKLTQYLNTIPEFKGVTLQILQSQVTWQYYFKSKFAKGNNLP